MGNSTTVDQFTGKLRHLADALGDNRPALMKTGMAGKRIFQASAASAGVLNARIAGKRKAVGVRFDIRDNAVTVAYTGPAHLVNNPTKPHEIRGRRARGSRRRRGATALAINGDVRASAQHPGTRGKHFYEKARAVADRELPQVYARAAITEPMKAIFK